MAKKDLELREALQAALDEYHGNGDGELLHDRLDAYLNKGVDFRRVGPQSPFYYLRPLISSPEDRSAGRWCEICGDHGSHHTDKHQEYIPEFPSWYEEKKS